MKSPQVIVVSLLLILLGVIGASLILWFWFPRIAGAIQVISPLATVTLAMLTYAYVVTAREMVREMREARESEARPYIVVDFDFRGCLIHVLVENVGKGAAKNVQIQFTPPLITHKGKDFSNKGFIANGFPFFPPSKKFSCFFDTTFSYFKEGEKPPSFEVNAEYENYLSGKCYKEKYILDMSSYEGRIYERRKDVNDIAKTLEEICTAFKRVIKVDGIYMKGYDDLKREAADWEEMAREKKESKKIDSSSR